MYLCSLCLPVLSPLQWCCGHGATPQLGGGVFFFKNEKIGMAVWIGGWIWGVVVNLRFFFHTPNSSVRME